MSAEARQLPMFEVAQEQKTSDDYYTPEWLFKAMSLHFDLDVAAPPGGVSWIPCSRYFTKADDGLSRAWFGRVWMNPPYSEPEPWVDRFIAHSNGVCLVPMSNGRWFHRLWLAADGLVLPADNAFKFVGGGIPIRTVLAAFGASNVVGIGRIGKCR